VHQEPDACPRVGVRGNKLFLCTLVHTHMPLWHFFPAMQLNFAPSNSWIDFLASLPREAEKAAGMQEKFKREEGGGGCFPLQQGCPGGDSHELAGAEAARPRGRQAVPAAVWPRCSLPARAGVPGLLGALRSQRPSRRGEQGPQA